MLLPIICLAITSISACSEKSERYFYRNKFLSEFPNHHKLNNLSLIGTYGSESCRIRSRNYRSQSLTIKEQLNYGVRVLDIGLRSVSNRFAIHSGTFFLDKYFEDLLFEIEEFLKKNPREFVIVFIEEDYSRANDVTKSNCEILERYKKFKRVVTDWSLKDTFKKVRGKILLASRLYGSAYEKCVVNLHAKCLVQNKECGASKSVDEIDNKWNSIETLQRATFFKKRHCFINNMNYYGSKHSADVIANYGYVNPINGECVEAINKRMTKNFVNSHRGLNIVLGVFVTQELIDKINFSNYPMFEQISVIRV